MACKPFHLLLISLTTLTIIHAQPTLRFDDVTAAVGITQREGRFKWGGPCVADLDGDGIYDLILSFHQSAPVQIYWGKPDGTFKADPFTYKADVHGINVGYRTAGSKDRLLTINHGGGRGTNLRPPYMVLVKPERTTLNVSNEFGLGAASGRGRITLYMDLALDHQRTRMRKHGGPDLLVLSFVDGDDGILQHAYENNRGFYKLRRPIGFERETEGRAAVVDLDGDNRMEVVSFPQLQIYKLVAPFKFQDVTEKMLGFSSNDYSARTVSSVTEFDMNNRGEFDLYVARTEVRDLLPRPKPGLPISDVLFKQTPFGLVDISSRAGIPTNTRSTGVTSGDFDNNGFVDVFVAVADGPDFFLMNNGDETFTRVNELIPKEPSVPGGHAVAIDYDQDGRLDLIVGQGHKDTIGGPYRVMRNVIPRTENSHYLLVRVGHHPRGVATALHAVVTVRVGGMKMMRRVGSPGTQAGGPSLLDTLHFGLSAFDVVDSVSVQWVAGRAQIRRKVAADQKITFGRV